MTRDTRSLRNSLGMFATGVTIVTAADEEGSLVGVTVSSFNSVSLDPPLVLFSIGRSVRSLNVLRAAGGYAVSVLAADQAELSGRFASQGVDKWTDLELEFGVGGAPFIPGAIACFECRPHAVYDGGDHEIFLGRVVRHHSHPTGSPLVFFGGGYRRLQELPPSRRRGSVHESSASAKSESAEPQNARPEKAESQKRRAFLGTSSPTSKKEKPQNAEPQNVQPQKEESK